MSSSASEARPVANIVTALRTLEGEGFEVRRAIPGPGYESIGPFIMLDHFGPVEYGPGEAKGAPEHPHFGFETLTYLLEGYGLHRDSIGNVSITGPGEAQWMRAGRGIVHDEGADAEMRRTGGRSHGVQLWINLPRAHKEAEPAYKPFTADTIPTIQRGEATIRLLAGTLDGAAGPVETFAQPWLAHVSLPAGATAAIPVPAGLQIGAYVLLGSGRFGPAGKAAAEGQLVRFARDGVEVVFAADGALDLLLLGGPDLDAPILRYGPFVASDKEQLFHAVRAYQDGRMGQIDFARPVPARRVG